MSSPAPTSRVAPPPFNIRLRDWLQLCRAPNVFTALADPLAGALVVGAGWRQTGMILIAMVASACLYSGGIMLNDWHDYKKDLLERPHRPLPSKRIPRWRALAAAVALLILGQVLASALGPTPGGVSLLLVAAIVMYDVLFKHIPIAPAFMGLCRALNLLLGMSLVTGEGYGPLKAYAATAMALYVIGITVFAQREARASVKNQLLLGAGFTVAPLLMLAPLARLFPQAAPHSSGVLPTGLLLAAVAYRMSQAIMTPEPAKVQTAVKTAVLGIVLLDAALVTFTRGLPLSVLVLILIVPALWLGRWLYST